MITCRGYVRAGTCRCGLRRSERVEPSFQSSLGTLQRSGKLKASQSSMLWRNKINNNNTICLECWRIAVRVKYSARSETVGHRTRPVRDKKKSIFVLVLYAVVLVLVLQVWCYAMKHGLVTLVVIMILKDTANSQVLFIVSLFCAWNITTVEINSGVYLLKS